MSLLARKILLSAAGASSESPGAALFEFNLPNTSNFIQWDDDYSQYISHNKSSNHLREFYGFSITGTQNFSLQVDTGYSSYSEIGINNSIYRPDGYSSGNNAFISGSVEVVSGNARPAQVFTVQDGASSAKGFDTSSSQGSWRVNNSPQSGSTFYPKENVASSGTLDAANNGGIMSMSFDGSDNGHFHFGSVGSNIYTDRITWPGADRHYPQACVGSALANCYWNTSIFNYPSNYSRGLMAWQRDSSNQIQHSSVVGRSTSDSDHSFVGIFADPRYAYRCLTALNDSHNDTVNITSWDTTAQVKDQICLKKPSSSAPPNIVAMFTNNSVNSNDVYLVMQDPDSNYTFYIVHWEKSDDSASHTGGASANTGGTFNKNGTAKKLVFDSSYKKDQSHSMRSPGWGEVITSPLDSSTQVLSFAVHKFTTGNNTVIFNIPKDLTLLQDGTVSGVVTISSGSAVNTEINAYLSPSNAVSWGTSVGYTGRGQNRVATSASLSNYSATTSLVSTNNL